MESAGSWTIRALTAAAAAAILIPVALYARPPVLDFANHAARIWLMNGGLHSPGLAQAYAADWAHIVSNIGVDLLGAALAPLTGSSAAARTALALAVVVPALGLIALNARLAGKLTWWSVALPVFAWTSTLLYGFLNFQIGVGLALLAAAADSALSARSGWAAALGRAAFGAVILAFHPFAALFYAALLAALSLGADWRSLREVRSYATGALAAAAALTPFLLWVLLSPRLPLANFPLTDITGAFQFDVREAAIRIAAPLLTYHTLNNALDLAFILLVAAACTTMLFARRARLHLGLSLLALGLAVATMLMPRFLIGTDLSARTGLMMVLAAAAAFAPTGEPALWRRAAALAALTLVCARTAWIGAHWNRAQEDVAAVELALRDAPAGAAVLVLARTPTDEGRDAAPIGRYLKRQTVTYWHYGAYAVIDRSAFVPTLFTAENQQPLRVREPYDDISSPLGCYMVPAQALYDRELASNGEAACAPYVRHWRERFHYVLVLNADEGFDANGPFTTPPGLSLQRDAGFAALYRIDRLPLTLARREPQSESAAPEPAPSARPPRSESRPPPR